MDTGKPQASGKLAYFWLQQVSTGHHNIAWFTMCSDSRAGGRARLPNSNGMLQACKPSSKRLPSKFLMMISSTKQPSEEPCDAVLQRLAVKHKVHIEVQRVFWNASAGAGDQNRVLCAVGQHLPQPPKRPLQGREASQKTRHKQHVLNVVGRRTQLRVLLRCESLPQRLDLRLLAGRWPAHARLGCLRVGGAGTPRCLLLLTARPEHKDHEGCNNEHERARASEIHQRCRSGYGIERPLHRCMLGPMCKSLAEAPMQRGVVENAVVENCVRGAVGK
mmetsp:Transcript_166413/g.528649  ORF Transcript_166413/g.528649 Transcript_166413/m.528649 type:complete len:276 (-) Transcript_166413:4-831(-)